MLRAGWLEVAILVLALLFRATLLDLKPLHFDEGVNGWFVDRMTADGCYHYDPTNFHGPLHFYLLLIAQTLFGRHPWALRLPIVLISTLCVGLCFIFRRFWSPATCRLAALAMAVSPAMTFYGRYAIHESELLFFLLLMTWGLLGIAREGDFRSLAATALGATGCVLTKETYLIHFVAFALAWPTLRLLERLLRESPPLLAPALWTRRQLSLLLATCAGLIVFFYSGTFQSWPDLAGLVTTFGTWIKTGTDHAGGQNKPPYYWLQLLGSYEWPTAAGLLAALGFVFTRCDRGLRYLWIAAFGTAVAYALVPYKTPWCLMVLMWPFFFALGEGLRRLWATQGRWKWVAYAAPVFAAILFGHSSYAAIRLNFYHSTDEEEPYVYVQTLPEISHILTPLRQLVAHDPTQQFLKGFTLFPAGDGHPLPWLLAEYPNIEALSESGARPNLDAEFLLINDQYVSDVEDRLRDRYFREAIVVRGQAGGEATYLYLRASLFAPVFPEREPEFDHSAAVPSPTTDTPPSSPSGEQP